MERYNGSFWKLDELKKFVQQKLMNRIKSPQLQMDDSNEWRLRRRKEREDKLKREIPNSNHGTLPLKQTKGENGLKFNK